MSKKSLYRFLALNAALVLFSLSPLAPFLGMLVTVVFVVPLLAAFALGGGAAAGYDADNFVAISFLSLGVVCAISALVLFYKAADESEKNGPDEARSKIILGVNMLTAPLVMYLSYEALGI